MATKKKAAQEEPTTAKKPRAPRETMAIGLDIAQTERFRALVASYGVKSSVAREKAEGLLDGLLDLLESGLARDRREAAQMEIEGLEELLAQKRAEIEEESEGGG